MTSDGLVRLGIVAEAGKRSARYVVTLSSSGNPDFGQNQKRPVPGVPDSEAAVDSLREASKVYPRVLSVEESTDIRAARSWAIATRACFPSFKEGRFP